MLFGWLISFDCKMNFFDCLSNCVRSKPSPCVWVNTLLHNKFDNFSHDSWLLTLSLFICNLKFSFGENYFDDLKLGFVSKIFIQVGFSGKGSVGSIFIDFFGLKDFSDIFFNTISPIQGFIPVAGNLEIFFVDFIANGGYIGHLDVCWWLL